MNHLMAFAEPNRIFMRDEPAARATPPRTDINLNVRFMGIGRIITLHLYADITAARHAAAMSRCVPLRRQAM
jgi:hypothetical protein